MIISKRIPKDEKSYCSIKVIDQLCQKFSKDIVFSIFDQNISTCKLFPKCRNLAFTKKSHSMSQCRLTTENKKDLQRESLRFLFKKAYFYVLLVTICERFVKRMA